MLDEKNLTVESISLSKITPYARNPRDFMNAVPKVQASIKEFGFRQPIVVDKDFVIVCGHARYYAAQNLELDTVPVHIASNLSDIQAKAYRLADNRTHEEAKWDEDLLSLELQELRLSDFDLSVTGFDSSELDNLLLGEDGHADDDPDKIPETPNDPITVMGDIWQLGKHRLICGDCTLPETYKALLGQQKADLLLTDPPYNVNYEGLAGKIANDDMPQEQYAQFMQSFMKQAYHHLKKGSGAYVFYSERETLAVFNAFIQAGFKQSSCLVWRKNHFVLGRQDYHAQHEPIIYGWKPEGKHKWYGGRKKMTLLELGEIYPVSKIDDNSYHIQIGGEFLIIHGQDISVDMVKTSIIDCKRPMVSKLHPTMKPVELMEQFIRNSSARGDIVLDCFAGSGSTLIACEETDRISYNIELSPHFCDVIIGRWQERTGQKAQNALTGKYFDE